MIFKTLIFTVSLIALIAIGKAQAAEQNLATVYNDESKTTYKLIVDSIDGRQIKAFFKDVFEKGIKVRRETLNHRVLTVGGMVLEQREKHTVMKLKSNNFDIEQGGIITIDTLYNGATGERRGYDVQLSKDKNGWALFKQGKVIKDIYIQTNKVMIIGAVGIKNLVMK